MALPFLIIQSSRLPKKKDKVGKIAAELAGVFRVKLWCCSVTSGRHQGGSGTHCKKSGIKRSGDWKGAGECVLMTGDFVGAGRN
jgi:hypothetical protein